MDGLAQLLQAKREAGRARRREARIRAGKLTGKERLIDTVAVVTMAAFWLDFQRDLDQMLVLRDARLWVVAKGGLGQAYLEWPGGQEVIAHCNRRRRVIEYHGTESDGLGGDWWRLVKAHGMSVVLAFQGNELALQVGKADVSDRRAMTLARCRDRTKAQYCVEQRECEAGVGK